MLRVLPKESQVEKGKLLAFPQSIRETWIPWTQWEWAAPKLLSFHPAARAWAHPRPPPSLCHLFPVLVSTARSFWNLFHGHSHSLVLHRSLPTRITSTASWRASLPRLSPRGFQSGPPGVQIWPCHPLVEHLLLVPYHPQDKVQVTRHCQRVSVI